MVKGDECSVKDVVWSAGAGVGNGNSVSNVDDCGLGNALRLWV